MASRLFRGTGITTSVVLATIVVLVDEWYRPELSEFTFVKMPGFFLGFLVLNLWPATNACLQMGECTWTEIIGHYVVRVCFWGGSIAFWTGLIYFFFGREAFVDLEAGIQRRLFGKGKAGG